MRFILVDTIHELEPGKRITASKRLPADEEIFRDHFPGFPVVPGVLLTEMMAQAAGKCLDADGSHPGRAMLGKIRSASFREWVRPDERAIIRAEITQNRPAYAAASCLVEVNGKQVCSADLFFVFVPHDQFAPGYRDEVLDAYWKANPPTRTTSSGRENSWQAAAGSGRIAPSAEGKAIKSTAGSGQRAASSEPKCHWPSAKRSREQSAAGGGQRTKAQGSKGADG